ncbi:MAG: squalene--hopene cyclase [Pirellulales bacterium]|nr:squalene--hopene cyclase [Pirellulales bacterium]
MNVRYSNPGMRRVVLGTVAFVLTSITAIRAAEPTPVTLDNVVPPSANSPDEPLLGAFSRAKAEHFLDSAALAWQKNRNCMTCHTNYLYLMSRPETDLEAPAVGVVRDYAEKLVTERWEEKGPRWDAEVIMTAAVLASHDAAQGQGLHPVTRKALDRIWTVQREDGGFSWKNCGWPPMELDDYFGIAMVALAAGFAPDDYQHTPAAKAGLEQLARYVHENEAPSLHHHALLAWASTRVDGLMNDEERQTCVEAMLTLQHADGGWGLATLGDWKRQDGSPQDLDSSDGYGTGFVIFLARQLGVPANDPRLAHGVEWLKTHQRESGRWFTRSLYKDNKHFLTHAGTAYAVMALEACDAFHNSPTE